MTKAISKPSPAALPAGVKRGRILVVDDEPEVREVLEDILTSRDMDVDVCSTCEDALVSLESQDYDVVLADHFLGDGMTGVELCGHIAERWPTVPTIILTAYGNLEVAIAALRSDAFDFLTKPCHTEHLIEAVNSGIQTHELREAVVRVRSRPSDRTSFGDMIGESRPMRAVFHSLERAASTDLAVLVSGEGGTGKDMVVQALHDCSPRKDGPFQVVRCLGSSPDALAREFQGEDSTLSRAAGGTFVVDHVDALDGESQAILVRALQEQAGRDDRARVLATTTKDLRKEASAGRFREDLLYRLNALHVALPPLRERGHDVLFLAQHFLARAPRKGEEAIEGLTPEVAAKFLSYPWPGNVRELENVMERAATLADHQELSLADVPEEVRVAAVGRLETGIPEDMPSLADLEQEHIARVLSATEGNKQRSARILGVDRSTLYRKMDRYGIVWESRRKP